MTLTAQKLQYAEQDCDVLANVVNGSADAPDVLTRFGVEVPTMARMIASITFREETATNSATAAGASAAAAAASAAQALLSKGQAAAYAVTAATKADSAEATRAQIAALRDAIQALIDGYPGAAGQTIPVADRAAAKAIANPLGSFYLYESGREGDFVVVDYATISALLGADPNEGVYFRSTATPAKAFLRKPPGWFINPRQFGALGGYNRVGPAAAGPDDSGPINALLTFWKNNPVYRPDFLELYWGTASTITISQDSLFGQKNMSMRGGHFVALNGTVGTDLVVLNFKQGLIDGVLGAWGNGGTMYDARGWKNGIRIVDSNGIKIPAGIELQSFRRHGVWCDQKKLDGSSGGNNIGIRIGGVKGYEVGVCAENGSALRRKTYTFDNVIYTGTSNSTVQTTTVHFAEPLDPDIAPFDKFCYTEASGKRTAYEIKSVDFVANTITFYLWLPLGLTNGTMEGNWGCLVLHEGGNTAYGYFGEVTGIGCGVVWADRGLYGPTCDFVGGEACGIMIVKGTEVAGAANLGGLVASVHSEGNYLDLFVCGPLGKRLLIGPMSAWATIQGETGDGGRGLLPQTYKAAARLSNGNLGTFRTMNGVTMIDETGSWLMQEGGPPQGKGFGDASPVTLSNRPHERHFRYHFRTTNANVQLNIAWYQDFVDLFNGKNWIEAECWGVGPRNEIGTLNVSLTAAAIAAGYTLNGSTSTQTFTRMKGPAIVRIVQDVSGGTNLRLSIQFLEPPTLYGVTYQGDAGLTLAVGTHTKTQICTTPLTANRNWFLSAAAGSAKNGDRFRIVRSAASTGAFLISVFANVTRQLAAGTWCEVEYDGSAWQLIGYGAL